MGRFVYFILFLGTIAGSANSALTFAAETKSHVLFYMDPNRLMTFEFQILSGDKSFEKAWEAHLEQLFKKLDKNNDGTIAGEERNHLPNTRILRAFNQSYTFRAPPISMDGKSFKDYIETNLEFPPFQFDIRSQTNLDSGRRRVITGMSNNADKAAEVLFSHLDQDSDGKLSREEMKQAQKTLHKQDLDQDETISTAELVDFNYGQFLVSPSSPTSAQKNTMFLALGKRSSAREIISQLTQKYDKTPKDNALTQQELGIPENLFANHDIDGNGKWDFEELQQYLKAPTADVVIKVRLESQSKSSEPRIGFEHGEELHSDFKNSIGSLNLGNVQMEVSLSETGRRPGGKHDSRRLRGQLEQQFQAIDRDSNGYIDREESQRLGNANAIFLDLDRNRDEKVFLEEWVEQILPLAELMSRQVRVTVADRGRDLFRILDSDGDNRLATREFRAMPDRAALWDRDADGQITLTDVPRQFRLVVAQGDFGVIAQSRGQTEAENSLRTSQTPNGPLWFQRMDRNNDGDLSFREFLGPREDFQKLDENQDGLISPTEAASTK